MTLRCIQNQENRSLFKIQFSSRYRFCEIAQILGGLVFQSCSFFYLIEEYEQDPFVEDEFSIQGSLKEVLSFLSPDRSPSEWDFLLHSSLLAHWGQTVLDFVTLNHHRNGNKICKPQCFNRIQNFPDSEFLFQAIEKGSKATSQTIYLSHPLKQMQPYSPWNTPPPTSPTPRGRCLNLGGSGGEWMGCENIEEAKFLKRKEEKDVKTKSELIWPLFWHELRVLNLLCEKRRKKDRTQEKDYTHVYWKWIPGKPFIQLLSAERVQNAQTISTPVYQINDMELVTASSIPRPSIFLVSQGILEKAKLFVFWNRCFYSFPSGTRIQKISNVIAVSLDGQAILSNSNSNSSISSVSESPFYKAQLALKSPRGVGGKRDGVEMKGSRTKLFQKPLTVNPFVLLNKIPLKHQGVSIEVPTEEEEVFKQVRASSPVLRARSPTTTTTTTTTRKPTLTTLLPPLPPRSSSALGGALKRSSSVPRDLGKMKGKTVFPGQAEHCPSFLWVSPEIAISCSPFTLLHLGGAGGEGMVKSYAGVGCTSMAALSISCGLTGEKKAVLCLNRKGRIYILHKGNSDRGTGLIAE